MKKIITIILFVFTISFLSAQENYDDLFKDLSSDAKKGTSESVSQKTDMGFELGFSGKHTFKFGMPVDPDNFNFKSYIKSPKFLNDLGIDISYKGLKVVSHWGFDIILNELYGKEAIDQVDVSDLLKIRPLENKIEYSIWKIKAGVGYQYFTWGMADKLNPTDNINPRDYRDVSIKDGTRKDPSLSAYLGIYPANFMSIDVVYVPFGEKTYFPMDIAEEISDELRDNGMSANVDYITQDFDPKKFKLGGKVNFFLSNVDFSFSYLYDLDPYYTPVIELKKADLSPLAGGSTAYNFYQIDSIDLVQKRLHQFGFDIKTVIKKVGLWAEFCYTLTENYDMSSYDIRKHKLNWVVGMDMNYGPNNDFYFNIQYSAELNPLFYDRLSKDYDDTTLPASIANYLKKSSVPFTTGQDEEYYAKYYARNLTNKIGNVNEGLNQGLVVKFEWPFMNSMFKPSMVTGYYIPLIYDYDEEIRYGTLLLNPEFDIMPFDSFHITIGSNLFYSWHKPKYEDVSLNRDYKYGRYTQDNIIYLMITYKWNYLLKK